MTLLAHIGLSDVGVAVLIYTLGVVTGVATTWYLSANTR